MNLPAAVLAAMAICNQHEVATRSIGNGIALTAPILQTCTESGCILNTDPQYAFMRAYAWEAPYQVKCKQIQDYVGRFQSWLDKKAADAEQANEKAAKVAEQPTLDKGIAALAKIKNLKQ